MPRKYKCPYCDKRDERSKLVSHIERVHTDLIPDGYSGTRVVFEMINHKTSGVCRVCKKETQWNEKAGRFDTLCGNPKCKEKMREEYKKNMLRVRGTYNILNDPEQQKKMLANRKISGKYKFSDGGTLTYTGSYEQKFLEFVDEFMQIPSKDIMAPGPTLEYMYNGKKHFYITDFLYIPFNLIVEIKDGEDNLNGKNTPGMIASRQKTIEKEKIITEQGIYNYIRLTNNNFAQLLDVFMELKEKSLNGDTTPLVRVNESTELIEESYEYDNLTKFSAYHLEPKVNGFNKDKSGCWDEELYSKSIDYAIKNDIIDNYKVKDQDKIQAYVYTTTKDLNPIYLGILSIRKFDNGSFDWEWDEQETLSKEVYIRIMQEPIEESYEYLEESMKNAVNDKGEKVPEICPKCGDKVAVFIQGEPVFLCKGCKKFFGVLPFHNKKKKKIKESFKPFDFELL